jgi:hypothetical protein
MFSVKVPGDEDVSIKFKAKYDLSTSIFDSRGSPIDNNGKKIDIVRQGKKIIDLAPPGDIVKLPPGEYVVKVYSDNKLIGVKNIDLINDKNVKIVTKIESVIPTLVTWLILIFIVEILVLVFFKKISLNTFFKLLAMSLILLSLFHPWWALHATSNESFAEKTTEMFIVPQTMIDSIKYNQWTYLESATIPEIFTNFLGGLLLIVCSGFFLLGLSFIPNIIYKKRYSTILISSSVLFFILVSAAYVFGMSKLTELSLGHLQGSGVLDVILPDKTTVYMNANWGLGIGFYLVFLAAIIAIFAGVVDYLRKTKRIRINL